MGKRRGVAVGRRTLCSIADGGKSPRPCKAFSDIRVAALFANNGNEDIELRAVTAEILSKPISDA